jgi:hypothetical protein
VVTNIRFEKNFTSDLCRLLKESGCIAVSGGLETASDRLLKLINKGVTVSQVAKVADNFTRAGIMVHAYLMYGFPTQTAQETIDSLETVRQLFLNGVIQSAFWHRFAMTMHSEVGRNPGKFKVSAGSHRTIHLRTTRSPARTRKDAATRISPKGSAYHCSITCAEPDLNSRSGNGSNQKFRKRLSRISS